MGIGNKLDKAGNFVFEDIAKSKLSYYYNLNL